MALTLDTALPMLARDPAAPFDLAELALLIARDEFPTLDVEAHLGELANMAQTVHPYLTGHLAHQVQGFCRYLFLELGFRGNQQDYYDPRNSYLNQVLERRLGIPIALATVMMSVGARAGLRIVGLGLPSHFIVKAVSSEGEIMIDPFHGGRVLSLADCDVLVRRATGRPFEASAGSFESLPLGLILQRTLGNLKAIYARQEDWPRSIRVIERMRQLAPEDVILRRDLGYCHVQLQEPGKAIDHLRRYVEAAQEAADADAVRNLLNKAMKQVAQCN